MNSGGELQLTAVGVQNDYMIGNPQVSFYKVVYNRHTNFSMANIKLNSSEREGSITKGSEVLIDVPRNGDLLSKCYLEMNVTNNINFKGDNNNLQYGNNVSISDKYIIISDSSNEEGRVYVYKISDYDIENDNSKAIIFEGQNDNDQYGYSIDITDNYIIVGAKNFKNANDKGRVYLYKIDDFNFGSSYNGMNDYSLIFKGQEDNSFYGLSVGITDTHFIVGSPGYDNTGRVYVYKIEDFQEYFNSTNNNATTNALIFTGENEDDQYGWSVAITDNYFIVGADDYRKASGSNYLRGRIYVYKISDFDGTDDYGATHKALIFTGENEEDKYGYSVAITDTYFIVGASEYSSHAGRVYVYKITDFINDFDGSDNSATDNALILTGENNNDNYGWSVAITDTYFIVGAFIFNLFTGRVYVYKISDFINDFDGSDNSATTNALILTGENLNNYYGYSVGITDTYFIVGSPLYSDSNSGRVYLYYLSSNNLKYIDNIQCLINNNVIDSHSYRYIHSYMSSLVDTDTLNNYYAQQYTKLGFTQSFQIPLLFWFCKNNGNALPLIALQYSPVQFRIKLSDTYEINSLDMYCNYIFLDTKERRQIALTKHEYLIEQVQENKIDLRPSNGLSEVKSNCKLELYYSIKYLLWYLGKDKVSDSSESNNIYLTNASLRINNKERFEEQDYNYFKNYEFLVNGYSNSINNNFKKSYNYINSLDDESNIQYNESLIEIEKSPLYYMYSFCLKPYHIQPSGTLNFSILKNSNLIIKHKSLSSTNTTTSKLHLFAINYNILKIEYGIGALLFNN